MQIISSHLLGVNPPAPTAGSGDTTDPTDILTFEFGNQHLRVVIKDGEPWWLAADVCAVLGIANPRQALTRLDEDERSIVGSTDGGPK